MTSCTGYLICTVLLFLAANIEAQEDVVALDNDDMIWTTPKMPDSTDSVTDDSSNQPLSTTARPEIHVTTPMPTSPPPPPPQNTIEIKIKMKKGETFNETAFKIAIAEVLTTYCDQSSNCVSVSATEEEDQMIAFTTEDGEFTADNIIILDVIKGEDGVITVIFAVKDKAGSTFFTKDKLYAFIKAEGQTIAKLINAENIVVMEEISTGGGGLKGWEIALIVIFTLLFVGLIVAILIVYLKKKKGHLSHSMTGASYSSISSSKRPSNMIDSRPVTQAYSNPAYDRSSTTIPSATQF